MFPFMKRDDDWRQALEAVEARLDARVLALEEERAATRVERADWAERLERLFHRVRMANAREARGRTPTDDQDVFQQPPEQVSDLDSIRAIRRKRGV
jgi:hypothetical protein